MPLYPIENTENLSDSYARIECKITVDFTEEIDADLLDRLDRSVHFDVGMLVSYMMGQAKMQMNTDGSSGVVEVRTRSLMPAEAIAEYYRELADAADVIDGDDDLASVQQEIAEAVEALAAKQDGQDDTKEPIYNCMLKAGDRVRLDSGCGTVLPPKRNGQFVVFVRDDSGNERLVQPSKITAATRGDVYLPQERDGNWVTFFEPDRKTSESTATQHTTTTATTATTPFEYPCGLQTGDEVVDNVKCVRWTVRDWDNSHEPTDFLVRVHSTGNGEGTLHTQNVSQAFRNGKRLDKSRSNQFTLAQVFREKPEPYTYPCGLMEGDVVVDKKHQAWNINPWKHKPSKRMLQVSCAAEGVELFSIDDIGIALRNGKQLQRKTTPDGVIFSEAPLTGS